MTKTTNPLYFDTAATTHIAPEVLAAMVEHLGSAVAFANPSSAVHAPGRVAFSLVEVARGQIATELGCEVDEVIFTSGATLLRLGRYAGDCRRCSGR